MIFSSRDVLTMDKLRRARSTMRYRTWQGVPVILTEVRWSNIEHHGNVMQFVTSMFHRIASLESAVNLTAIML